MTGFWDDAEVISEYSRAQAIADGSLVLLEGDLAASALEAGFRCDVALTRALFGLVEPTEAEAALGQSVTGRLWDVLNMARLYSKPARDRELTKGEAVASIEVTFPCIFVVAGRDGAKRARSRTFLLWFHLGPGDTAEPVVTVGFPEDR